MKKLKTYSQISFNNVHNYTIYYMYIYLVQNKIIWILLLNNILMIILLEKLNSNTWFVNEKTFMANTWINKIKYWYLKPSFGLGIYITIFLPIYHNITYNF